MDELSNHVNQLYRQDRLDEFCKLVGVYVAYRLRNDYRHLIMGRDVVVDGEAALGPQGVDGLITISERFPTPTLSNFTSSTKSYTTAPMGDYLFRITDVTEVLMVMAGSIGVNDIPLDHPAAELVERTYGRPAMEILASRIRNYRRDQSDRITKANLRPRRGTSNQTHIGIEVSVEDFDRQVTAIQESLSEMQPDLSQITNAMGGLGASAKSVSTVMNEAAKALQASQAQQVSRLENIYSMELVYEEDTNNFRGPSPNMVFYDEFNSEEKKKE